ncbi:MAG: tRNA (adenosine(37)-N6)-threonylcarbamoyltransferase complex dimerization subunit type 1 TsaB [Balneolaceae bacterium]|nr:tRNA (adenosine(37)-N6)-threonylcarbamoyltransferase complex dimerization subunit type 1 TsaB [Balneolaceae bacterium]
MLLALETSTNVCSVAFSERRGDIHEKRTEKRGAHSEQLFLFIETLMDEHQFRIAELDAVLVSEGPGSYTGLRIGASAVKGLLFGTGIPLYAVQTLAGFAESARRTNTGSGTIHAVIDARRVHLYHQSFTSSSRGPEATAEVGVRPIEQVEALIEPGDTIIGTGIQRMEGAGEAQDITRLDASHISARSLISLYRSGQSKCYRQCDPEQFDPTYLTSRQISD